MNCPVCKRKNENELSVCISCGAMTMDSVREEMEVKIIPLSKPIAKPTTPLIMPAIVANPLDIEIRGNLVVSNKSNPNPFFQMPKKEPVQPKPPIQEISLSEMPKEVTRQKSANLVEFNNENAKIPEWRLKVQNAVEKRRGLQQGTNIETDQPPVRRANLVTSGANALKTEMFEETEPADIKNPTLAKALRRIEKSRNQFFEEPEEPKEVFTKQTATGSHMYMAAKENEILPRPKGIKATINEFARPKQEKSFTQPEPEIKVSKSSQPVTNESLSHLQPARISTSLDKPWVIPQNIEPEIEETTISEDTFQHTEIFVREQIIESENTFEYANELAQDDEIEYAVLIEKEKTISQDIVFEQNALPASEEIEQPEIEDCAPFAMRFNAGLFDLIIGSFSSLILLAPFMAIGGEWFTFAGFLTFLATCSVIMFIYMTIAIGFFGRTVGMRLFSLEVVDIEGENYPTLHQAAVSSSLYLLSLAFGGIGFITLLLNPEKRAVHDLVSGTIVVKEL